MASAADGPKVIVVEPKFWMRPNWSNVVHLDGDPIRQLCIGARHPYLAVWIGEKLSYSDAAPDPIIFALRRSATAIWRPLLTLRLQVLVALAIPRWWQR